MFEYFFNARHSLAKVPILCEIFITFNNNQSVLYIIFKHYIHGIQFINRSIFSISPPYPHILYREKNYISPMFNFFFD